MATKSRAQAPAVVDQLFEEGHRFGFYQAVKILELTEGTGVVPGESIHREQEPVNFSGHVSQAFPSSDIHQIKRLSENEQPTLYANTLSLGGAHGPLPPPYSELLLDRNRRGDTGFSSFLDIFQHRLLAILYRQRKHLRIGLENEAPWRSRTADQLYSLMGMGTPGMRGRMQIADHHLLYYAGLFTPQIRGSAALEQLLKDFFQTNVEINSFQGGWESLPESVHTRLGDSRMALGESTVLGTRVWNQQNRFTMHFGPLRWLLFQDLLPDASAFRDCCELTRFYAGDEMDFDIELEIEAKEVPCLKLSAVTGDARLGWTSWIGRQSRTENGRVRLSAQQHHLHSYVELQGAFFSHLSDEEYRGIPSLSAPHRAFSGTTLIHQGVRNDQLYIFSSGHAEVIQRLGDNSRKLLQQVYPGEIYGEMSLMHGGLPIASVVTISDCDVYEVPRKSIQRLLATNERLARWMDKVVAERKEVND